MKKNHKREIILEIKDEGKHRYRFEAGARKYDGYWLVIIPDGHNSPKRVISEIIANDILMKHGRRFDKCRLLEVTG